MINWPSKKIRRYYSKHKWKRGIKIANNVDLDFNTVHVNEYVNLAHHSQLVHAETGCYISIGRYTKIQYATIGKYCSISCDCTIDA